MNISVRSAGFLTSVQDLGRTGFRRSGVSLSGALDAHSLRVANVLVGNEENAAGLEVTFGTVRLAFADDRLVAWCGGPFSVRIGEENIAPGHIRFVGKDNELTMIAPNSGGRAWLAISGGIDVPLVLGSRSTDLRGKFGGHEGRALRDGDVLSLDKERRFTNRREKTDGGLAATDAKRRPGFQSAAPWGAPATWARIAPDRIALRIVKGIDWDLFRSEAQQSLGSSAFNVTPDSDRMGVRLEGPELQRTESSDLLSEAVAPGTLQVPPNGQPILLLGDCQTIGGYPKIAHVITVDLPIAAQLSPGATVRFQEASLAEAQALLHEREKDFALFRAGVGLHAR
ncbi:MAG TPA: biotin-dependent carboxyltransferase family protein [Chthoniobacterales bacterium]|jgi:antagonist of KipI|nr:biotin-dependent carboxyltransferase family protein [Chthoniobacterales bacterium]